MSGASRLSVSLVVACGLVLLGILFRDGRVVALGIPFLVYGGVLLVAGLLERPPALKVERRLDVDRVEEGRPISVTLTVENLGRSIPLLGVREGLPAGGTVVEGETSLLCPLGPEERVTLAYTLRAPRGEHTFSAAALLAFDRLTLHPTPLSLPCPSRLLVLPHVETLEEIEISPRYTRAYSGSVRARLGGSGTDFFGCRDYALGDDVRRINWRAYGRREALVVNEYEQERIADVGVILDARERVNARVGKEETFAHSVRAAASVAIHFLLAGNHVGLLIYGDRLDWTYPGYGRTQRERILDALARARTADKVVFEDLRYIPTRLFPPRSQLVVVSPLAGEDDVEVLGTLRARGYPIILIAPNPLSLEPGERHAEESLVLARRVLRLKRTLLFTTLAGIGVWVVDWDLTQPLSYPASALLARKGRRFA